MEAIVDAINALSVDGFSEFIDELETKLDSVIDVLDNESLQIALETLRDFSEPLQDGASVLEYATDELDVVFGWLGPVTSVIN